MVSEFEAGLGRASIQLGLHGDIGHVRTPHNKISTSNAFRKRTAQPCDPQVHAAHVTITSSGSPVPDVGARASRSVSGSGTGRTMSASTGLLLRALLPADMVATRRSNEARAERGAIICAGTSVKAGFARLHPPSSLLCAGSRCVVHQRLPKRAMWWTVAVALPVGVRDVSAHHTHTLHGHLWIHAYLIHLLCSAGSPTQAPLLTQHARAKCRRISLIAPNGRL